VAYRLAEAAGVPVWCQDEAGPYQAIPQPGAAWCRAGAPRRQPHEYLRGGTAKLLTLFRPATGMVRAQGVTSAPNTVLHPWLTEELTQILAGLPAVTTPEEARPALGRWSTWLGHTPRERLPPLRLILIWDNLAGQHPQSAAVVIQWLEETVAGWNAAPTPFVWDGKRHDRRERARQRRLGGSPAVPATRQLIAV